MRRIITILVVLVLIVGGSLVLWQRLVQAQAPQTPKYETVTPTRSTLRSLVSATGSIEPEAQVSLTFKGVGRVAEVKVKATDRVEPGQVLATLDSQDVALSVAQAEASLASAQANLAQLTRKARTEDLEAAQASLDSAQANVKSAEANLASSRATYSKLLAGAGENDKKVAAANLERAQAALQQAQAAYDQVANLPNVGLLPQSLNLQRATIDYEQAKAQYQIATAGADAAQRAQSVAAIAQAEAAVANARAQVAQAKSSLVKLQEGATPEQTAGAQAQVKQAEAVLAQAHLNQDNAMLRSPIAGVVAQVNITPGEFPNAARAAIVVVNIDRFHIDISVDEIDIGQIQEGQPAEITLESLPNAKVTGRISQIAPMAAVNTGVVSYLVTVVLDPTTAPLRAGLSATANITTAEVENVLVLPNRAIQRDRTSDKTYVEKLVDDVPQRVEVKIGMRNEGQTQIMQGVSENDVIVIPNTTAGEQLRRTFGF